ncbi:MULTISPECIES: hypothetical protein [Paraburkholderia]|uniref:Uncharacterized protein n=1 Tax=Paraburkholderia madseniana TaxID=2599607 RepID=A0AAP5BAJ8_9BURK|nr:MULTISPECIES: hypothetical protein [Paraburkholderia]MCX4145056.1 hypothetical protein [Paraburkholderia madseniana]MDN7148007.1 hypothetical protein [Paraburkholderia sp. WS6]MDQ6406887.1 hypothetical protein [Paraburkholderia madseniana]
MAISRSGEGCPDPVVRQGDTWPLWLAGVARPFPEARRHAGMEAKLGGRPDRQSYDHVSATLFTRTQFDADAV